MGSVFTEQDVLAGRVVTPDMSLQNVIFIEDRTPAN